MKKNLALCLKEKKGGVKPKRKRGISPKGGGNLRKKGENPKSKRGEAQERHYQCRGETWRQKRVKGKENGAEARKGESQKKAEPWEKKGENEKAGVMHKEGVIWKKGKGKAMGSKQTCRFNYGKKLLHYICG